MRSTYSYPVCDEDENVIHILLKCKETQRWREQFLSDKYLYEKKEIRRKISCNNIAELKKKVGKFLYELKLKWESEVKKRCKGQRKREGMNYKCKCFIIYRKTQMRFEAFRT